MTLTLINSIAIIILAIEFILHMIWLHKDKRDL